MQSPWQMGADFFPTQLCFLMGFLWPGMCQGHFQTEAGCVGYVSTEVDRRISSKRKG